MRCGASLAPVLAAIIAVVAHAQGTGTTSTSGSTSGTTTSASGDAGTPGDGGTPAAPPGATNCFLIGPKVGSDLLSIGWTSSGGLGFVPGVRAGFWLPTGFLAGEAGLKIQASPGASYSQIQLNVGAVYGHELLPLWGGKLYGLGGLDVDLLAGSTGSIGYAQPVFGLTLGAGLKYPLNKSWTLGFEVGIHTQAELGYDVSASSSLCGSVVGTWCEPGACPYTSSGAYEPLGPTVAIAEETKTVSSGVPTHHSSTNTPCSVYVTDGWMEPTQAVWQDDVSFEDKAGKQLTRLEGDAVAYLAEMPMVTRKATLVFGVHHYRRAGAPVIVDSRDFIVLSGMTNCTTPKPVKFRFTLNAIGGPKTLWTSPEVGSVKLAGPPQKEYEPWSVRLAVREGVPPDNVFQIDTAGGYTVRAELLDEGNPTGLLMTVGGQALDMAGPAIHFVPVMLSKLDAAAEGSLQTLTELMAAESAEKIPDVFPLSPGGLPTSVRVIRNLVDAEVPSRWLEFRRISYLVAALNDTLAASTFLDGAGRVVAVMSGADFKSVFGTGAAGMTVAESVEVKLRGQSARSLSWKVMLVPSYETWDTVAHEILHTLPEGWANSEMVAECGIGYHNKKDPVAHGERITEDGVPVARERKVGMISVMGPSVSVKDVWMDQCTYWHLTKMLAGAPPDPPVTLLRAMIGKKGNKVTGELRPVYEMGGNADLRPGKGGPYAFVFKDAKGAELARFPFNPRATDIEMGTPLEVMSFVARAPLVAGWAQLELQDAKGAVLDKKVRSEAPPVVTIDAPLDGAAVTPADGKVRVKWTAAKAANAAGPLLSSVLYSTDGGRTWTDQAFEQTVSELDVKLNPKVKDHRVKVVATDGTRSAEAIIRLTTK